MTVEDLNHEIVRPADRLLMIVGNYGSGKTEVAVNLSIRLARAGRRVQIADLDIVNPYFRCREARTLMEKHGIRVVVPPGALSWSELPIILPEIQGMLRPPDGTLSVFDVGGDDVGAKVLASFRPGIVDGRYELWQVLNAKRPFTDSVEGCLETQRAIETTSRLKVTGLLVNTHLIEETTPDTVLDGWRLARAVAERTELPIRCVAVMERLADAPELAGIDAPVLRLRRRMLPPWLIGGAEEERTAGDDSAARPVPIGKPRPIRLARFKGDRNGQDRH